MEISHVDLLIHATSRTYTTQMHTIVHNCMAISTKTCTRMHTRTAKDKQELVRIVGCLDLKVGILPGWVWFCGFAGCSRALR